MPKNVNILFHPTVISPGIPTALCKIGGRDRDIQRQKDKRFISPLPRTPESRWRIEKTLMPVVVLRREDERR